MVSAVIKMDTLLLNEALCQNYGPDQINVNCGNSLVTHCSQGQRVFVVSENAATELRGYGKRCTFSGFLIQLDIQSY